MTVLQRFSAWWNGEDNLALRLPTSAQAQVVDYIKAAYLAGAAGVQASDFGTNELKRVIEARKNDV